MLDGTGRLLSTLTAGDVFGEMPYFDKKGLRSAMVIADSDLVLRRVSGKHLKSTPVIKKIFKKLPAKEKTSERLL